MDLLKARARGEKYQAPHMLSLLERLHVLVQMGRPLMSGTQLVSPQESGGPRGFSSWKYSDTSTEVK